MTTLKSKYHFKSLARRRGLNVSEAKLESGNNFSRTPRRQISPAYPRYKLRRAPTGSGSGALIKQY
jgi:hypothetical protein